MPRSPLLDTVGRVCGRTTCQELAITMMIPNSINACHAEAQLRIIAAAGNRRRPWRHDAAGVWLQSGNFSTANTPPYNKSPASSIMTNSLNLRHTLA